MQFAELNEVDLRSIWPNEASDFTPWLAANLDLLSQAIGIPLELEGTEVLVEHFSADILARNPADNSLVLIENQLEYTDHSHLGQILTYLAGLEAQTVIWVAKEFREPHLSAVRWLNSNTTEPFAFFAVRAKVVKIGDDSSSPMSLLFEIREKPNEWDRQLTRRTDGRLADLRQYRQDFWRSYAEQYPADIQLRPNHIHSNVYHEIQGIIVSQFLAQDRVGVYIQTENSRYTDHDRQRIQRIEFSQHGWHQYGLHLGISLRIDSHNRKNWPQMQEWLHETLETFKEAIGETYEALSP